MTDQELKDKILELAKESTFDQLEIACLGAIKVRLLVKTPTGLWAAQKWWEYIERVRDKAKILLTNAKKKTKEPTSN